MPVDPSGYDAAIAAIKKQYGDVVHMGDTVPPTKRVSFGSDELDYATNGGVPVGRFSRFYGGYSSAKTLTLMKVIAKAQKMGMTCAYYNIEKSLSDSMMDACGVKRDELVVVEGTTIEETGTKMEALMGSVHLHALDSLSSAVSVDELAGKLEDWHMGLGARVWGKVLRRTLERFDNNENTIILVDQVRDVFGTGGEEPPGGRFIEHTSSLSLYFRRAGWCGRFPNDVIDTDAPQELGISGSPEPAGIEFLVRVNKSRVCRPLRVARLRLDFRNMQFDVTYELAKAAKHFDVVRQKGAWYEIAPGDTVQGLMNLRERIEQDGDLQAKIRGAMRSV